MALDSARLHLPVALLVITVLTGAAAPARAVELTSLTIEPGDTVLNGRRAAAQLIATGHYADGSLRDLTHVAEWGSAAPAVVAVEAGGYVTPHGDGRAEVVARFGSVEARTTIEVRGTASAQPVRFEHEVLPALTKAGCNQGACHGTPTGKNGFRLILRGYDPELDFRTLTREADARRVDRLIPEASLILLKGSGAVTHQGGQRFTPLSLPYRILRDWVAEGLHSDPAGSPALDHIEVTPTARVLDAPARSQQLVVRAHFRDGSVRDVTRLARYAASDETLADVDSFGQARRKKRGEVTVLIHYESQVATSRLVFLEPVPGFAWTDPPANNFVDRHVFDKLKLLRIKPSDLCDDATFARRVFLDVIGVPPTPDELRAFLADHRAEKRSRLIDDLLKRPEYVDFWALKWSDRLGCNQRFTGLKGAYSYHRWIRDQVAANVPLDRFVRAIITAKGPNYTNPPSSFYRRIRTPDEAAESVSQLFLGVRLQCAKCHNHVAERWTQDDYYSFAAFFSQVRYKKGPQFFELYNKEETVYLDPSGEVVQPRTRATMAPKALATRAATIAEGEDRREALAEWLVAPSNPFFAKASVNRLWYHVFGRGIVDPVDDIRDSNPPASAELLQALADDFVAHRFDAQHTLRTILNSRTYQLASTPNPFNADDARYFSHATVRLLSAEQLLDAASQATEVPEALFHLPPGTRAAQVPDGELAHPFLRTFGQPPRSVACECERASDSTLEQALQVVGGRTLHAKIVAPNNRIGRLLKAGADNTHVVDELFLATLGRFPSAEERGLAIARFDAPAADRRRAAEDLLWSLFNHPEFLFQH
ncbi:MAG: DUF1549 and DUF1553 domain-containing protein [Isosphaeraceae bacterium]|nr:DUF1549 and DUF1553 domain-containing protein [Isosphaeraceae bacterium]